MTLLVISFVALVIGFALLGIGCNNLQEQFISAHAPQSESSSDTTDEVKSGPAQVDGTVQPFGDSIDAPFSDHSCLYYRLTVEEYSLAGEEPEWVLLESARSGSPFYIEHESGQLLVDPHQAELRIEPETIDVPKGVAPPEAIQKFGEQQKEEGNPAELNLNLFDLPHGRDLQFREYRIEPGQSLHVSGTVMEPQQGRSALYRDEEWVLAGNARTPNVIISSDPIEVNDDDDNDGDDAVFLWMIGGGAIILMGIAGVMIAAL